MAYTPNNNPYIPGDPYSYDLKWIVDQLKYAISLYEPLHDEFVSVKEEFESLRNFVNDYFDNLDISAEVSAKIEEMRAAGFFDRLIGDIVEESGTIESTVTQWLADNVTPTTPAVDASLSITGAAADAKAAGDKLKTLKNIINGVVVDYVDFSTVSNEYVNRNTGLFASYNGWGRTDYIPVGTFKSYYTIILDDYSLYCWWYDANHTPMFNFSIDRGVTRLAPPTGAAYFVVSSDAANMATLTIVSALGLATNEIVKAAQKIDPPAGLFPLDKWERGSISSTGNLTPNNYALRTDFIEAESGNTYAITITDNRYKLYVYEFNENRGYIRSNGWYYADDTLVLSENTKYIKFLAQTITEDVLMFPEDGAGLGMMFKKVFHPVINVMTYNVGHYSYGTGWGLPANIYDEKLINYRRFIGKYYPDIIGFQEYDTRMDEANNIWANDVLWNHYYNYEVVTGLAAAIKSRYPIGDGRYAQFTSSGRYYCTGYINGVYVLVVHLSVGTDAEMVEMRQREVAEILALVQNKEKFIIFGDFNAEPGEEDAVYDPFRNAGYKLANCGFFGNYYTWSDNRADFDDYENPTGSRLYYIDNIIVSPNIKIVNSYPIPSAYSKLSSDHIPVIATLEI